MCRRKLVEHNLFLVCCCAVIIGCGSEPMGRELPLSGVLLDGGQPARIKDFDGAGSYYEVTLQAVGAGHGGKVKVTKDGTFEILGIKAGAYRVGVAKMVAGPNGLRDAWAGKLAAREGSLTVDLDAGEEVAIHLDTVRAMLGVNPGR